tara:strand:+ start:763 stop:1854 length:1092 start_codon:yes stop_codon:yes gene_type:complete
MVTANDGLMSSNLSSTANRVLIDYKDAISDYKVTDMPVISLFAERFTTETGGDVDITFAKPSMALEQIEEGDTPNYQHTDLRNERISVKEWGLAVGVTRRMLEDSRFSEMEMALNEARRAVERHVTKHFVYTVFGLYDAAYNTGISGASILKTTTEDNLVNFANAPHGSFYGKDPATLTGTNVQRLYDYGEYSASDLAGLNTTGSHYFESGGAGAAAGDLALADITTAMELINAKGGTADTIMISPSHYKTLLNLADFTAPFTASTTDVAAATSKGGLDYVNNVSNSGLVGQLYGLNVYMNHWIPKNRYGVFDMKVKPVGYVERRGLTVEEANPGFGITGSYMTMRYGLKIIRPEAGVIVIGA